MTEHTTPRTGHVALIGGGPAQPDLITHRGHELLMAADVVVADRLGPRGLLDELRDDVEVIDVGKTPGRHTATQDEINALLVDRASRGLRVARLKGGDPYVLGRGSEEREHCRRHGITVEVVPGITSAVGVPAEAGIPLTHRGLSRGFTVITGHDDLDVVPRSEQHTLVILMGVSTLRRTATQLMVNGHDASTPVAIIESGGMEDQRVTLSRLHAVADVAARRQVANPAVIVVGAVVTLADDWPQQLDTATPAAPAAAALTSL
ncbi:uroporphyrinogen-III C-methyltransferase [Nesterenkonia sp. CL21]|uniref:uroporphyrinogen-III C-methyltransferase n=1 Tax=Nesterenkonia sp. CL21 TaxID=3064894 RepID=UPI00287997DD|nr:uroporphyrinogen-III C-methyltransferase [Nesterenkonia sp. CL21]MDS2173597.1 uroporphyrinogen-III C-methyltransferase [Nesterenkonia sp. CL21]